MSGLTAVEALDLACQQAAAAQRHALIVEPRSCGLMFPFGTQGERPCPVCDEPVYMHLGFADQRR